MVNASYAGTANPDFFDGDNETVHEFSILINNTELLHGKVRDQAYQIDPSKDKIIINFTKLNETMAAEYANRNSCFNISLTNIIVRNGQLIRLDPLPEINSVIDGIPYNQSSTLQKNISNNISLIFNPPTYWSGIEQIYINLTFNLTQNSNPGCAGIPGSRFLNNTFKSPFNYNYNSSNVMQPQLRDAVLEINIGSGARTVTEIVIEGLNAAFTYRVTSGSPIKVQFTDQSKGNPVEWAWDFDISDGISVDSTMNNPIHNYGASSGPKTITLTVKDANGVSDTTTLTIDLSAPVAGFSGTPVSGNAPLNVQFTDTSTGGAPTSWKWEYNKTIAGSWTQFSTSQNPLNTFTEGGIYDIRLTVTNLFGSDDEVKGSYITVLPPAPIANFTASPLSGTAPLTVAFTDWSTNTPTSWIWEYKNATVPWTQFSTAQNPSNIIFPAAGTYDIQLNATNAIGSNTATKIGYITVSVAPPVAGFTGTPTLGITPLTVAFTDTSTNTPTSWRWAYKNASVGWTQFATTQNPSFTFATGTYDINLTVTNAGGPDDEIKNGYITVTNIAPPVAGFTGTPTSGNAPLTVVFTDSSTNGPTSWRWAYKTASVGWTQFATTQNPSFAFAAGTYDINLTATNAGGSNTFTMPVYITVYTIQSFTSSTTWIAPTGVTSVEYLVIAGGGGGGGTFSYGYGGGGGGAGGLRTASGYTVIPGNSYIVTVGAGGAGGAAGAYSGTKGSDSRFDAIISTGGGYGAGTAGSIVAGGVGGSGGGGVLWGAGGAGIPGQGYAGGSDNIGWPDLCGGGGGSSQAGSSTTGSAAGKGGDGTASSISGSSVTYAGGGGGGSGAVYGGAPGGTGGGGAGGIYIAGNGADATGFGSGGGGATSALDVGARAGGKGSNGIVIIKYH
jgi:PKD repeat protein